MSEHLEGQSTGAIPRGPPWVFWRPGGTIAPETPFGCPSSAAGRCSTFHKPQGETAPGGGWRAPPSRPPGPPPQCLLPFLIPVPRYSPNQPLTQTAVFLKAGVALGVGPALLSPLLLPGQGIYQVFLWMLTLVLNLLPDLLQAASRTRASPTHSRAGPASSFPPSPLPLVP